MSRKSLAAVATVAVLPGQRPEPPEQLTEQEARVWRAVAATKPADWFTEDSHPLLIAYCRAAAFADQLSAEINAMRPKEGDDMETWQAKCHIRSGAVKHRDTQHAALVSLARSMRLSQQARYKAETANTAHEHTAKKKLWETG